MNFNHLLEPLELNLFPFFSPFKKPGSNMRPFLSPGLFLPLQKSHVLVLKNNAFSRISRIFSFHSFTGESEGNLKQTKIKLLSAKTSSSSRCEPLFTQSLHLPNKNPAEGQTRFLFSWPSKKSDFIFRQLLDYKSFTYTYLLADAESMEGVIIDPVLDNVKRDLKILKDLGVKLLAAMNTHVHADHITGSGVIKEEIASCNSFISIQSQAKADKHFDHGNLIKFGNFNLECRSTPGHTNGCYSFVWHEKNMVFTGDAVLIRGCGRTDFQQGDAEKLYDSVQQQIFSLPSHYLLFPGHDYTGQMMSTVGEEKKFNPRLSKSKSEFLKIMQELQLPYPQQIDKALPANLLCGIQPTE